MSRPGARCGWYGCERLAIKSTKSQLIRNLPLFDLLTFSAHLATARRAIRGTSRVEPDGPLRAAGCAQRREEYLSEAEPTPKWP